MAIVLLPQSEHLLQSKVEMFDTEMIGLMTHVCFPFLVCCSNGDNAEPEQLLSPLDRARQALESDPVDTTLMVSEAIVPGFPSSLPTNALLQGLAVSQVTRR